MVCNDTARYRRNVVGRRLSPVGNVVGCSILGCTSTIFWSRSSDGSMGTFFTTKGVYQIMKSRCLICDTENERKHYVDDWTCSTCEQEYSFDEGVLMMLTDKQYDILREHYQNTKDG